jgi:hypothetical protein
MGRAKWVVSGYPTSYRGAYFDELEGCNFQRRGGERIPSNHDVDGGRARRASLAYG